MVTDDAFADEIIEIFVEEVDEVLEQIDRYLPKWAANFADLVALKEIRRAFHTLKGSGRMVQADQIAELAWSVENMLNRLLDGTLAAKPQMLELVQHVSKAIPLLLEAFKNKQAAALAGINIQQLIDQAEALREGKEVSSLQEFKLPEQQETPAQAIETGIVEVDSVEMGALKEQMGGLMNQLNDLRRDWVAITTQVEALRVNIKSLGAQSIPEEISQQLQQTDREVKELKYFVKTSSETMFSNSADAQKRLNDRLERELSVLQTLSSESRAELVEMKRQIREEMTSTIKIWALGCSIAFSAMVLVATILM